MKKRKTGIIMFILSFVLLLGSFPMQANAATKTPGRVSVKSIKTSSRTSASVKVKWSKTKRTKKYQVAYKNSSKKKWKYKTVKKNYITLSGLSESTTYSAKIRSINGKKKSKWTKTVKVKTLSIAQDMLNQVNVQRRKAGVPDLKMYNLIVTTAQIKAKDMYQKKDMNHYSSSLGYFYNQYAKLNISYQAGGENIARGQKNVSQVMSAWMSSPGHKSNILSKDYTHIGVGYYKGYWVQQFIGNPQPR